MKFTRQQEIAEITKECTSFEELNRLARLQNIYIDEMTKAMSSIWVISAKLDKLIKELKHE